MKNIKFGTDGWRAIIADGYTFANVSRVAQATAQWVKKSSGASPSILIGHDTRFLGREFAWRAARVLAANGVRVVLADSVVTTPAVSWGTKHYGMDAGVVITASHNPPEYSGFKIKASFGGPASPEMIAEVEEELERIEAVDPLPSVDELVDEGRIEERDLRAAYLDELRRILDIDAIESAGLKIAHDPMFGAALGHVTELLGEDRVVEIHNDVNPGFHGVAPEPVEDRLSELSELVVEEGCAAGLANDGDGDRIGMMDENGRFVTSHELLALLVKYLHTERGLSGEVIKTFSTTHMLDRMGERYGLKVETTPIGFKYIASKMVEQDVLVGGEESGGLAVKGHVPERDGIYIGLLVVEMMVKRGKKLSELVEELHEEFGAHRTYRMDLHTSDEAKAAALRQLEEEGGLSEIAGHAVESVETLDGFKHLTGGGWLLIRPSGTEPVLRIYSEAPTAGEAEALVESAVDKLGLAAHA